MNIYISICSMRGTKYTTWARVSDMMDWSASQGIRMEVKAREAESLICRARQRSLADFYYQPEFTHLMTLDDDIIIQPDALIKMLNADKSVVGGFYRLKTHEYMGVAQRPKGRKWVSVLKEQKLVEADYVSTGCMLTKREVITDMINAYPELEYEENLTGTKLWAFYMPFIFDNGDFREYLSEDWAFCQRARDIGHSVWVHGGIQCGHWGEVPFTLEFEEDAKEVILPASARARGSGESE